MTPFCHTKSPRMKRILTINEVRLRPIHPNNLESQNEGANRHCDLLRVVSGELQTRGTRFPCSTSGSGKAERRHNERSPSRWRTNAAGDEERVRRERIRHQRRTEALPVDELRRLPFSWGRR